MLEIRLLGQFQVQVDGAPADIPSRPAQSLLAYLALNAGTPHRRERLAGLMWPESDEASARRRLRQVLWQVRKGLGPAAAHILADDIHITFDGNSPIWLDTAVLDRRQEGDVSAEALMADLAAYGGELLPGFYDNWVVLERERLQAVFERKMHQLLDQLAMRQRWQTLLEWGERWIALGHTPEPAYRGLMLAHAALGDSSAMVAAYQRCVEALDRDLGVAPSPPTRVLYERLLRGELTPPMGPAAYGSQVVGAYRLVEKLGEGGMAEVYKAYQPSLDRYVALKFIRPELVKEAGFLARFEREARVLARLSHPYIVHVYDFGQVSPLDGPDGRFYLAMQYVAGGTLQSWLAELRAAGQYLPLEQTGLILSQSADALDYAHRQGVIHRDIKPANIVLTAENQAMLSDFGIARLVGPASDLTQPGAITGTPDYMSPEQIRGQPDEIGPASDIYSLGVVLFEMVAGRVPFVGNTPATVLFAHLQDDTPPPRSLNPDLPDAVEAVVLRALAKNPADRYQTAGDLAQAFVQASGVLPAAVPAAWPVAADEAPAAGDPPYQGLHFFDVDDAGRFFGREALAERLAAHLAQHPFLAVVGASGSGKSSLLRAGLVPALKQAGATAVHIITPTVHPLESLAAALTGDSESVTATATLIDDLARDPRSLHLYAQRLVARSASQPRPRLVLVVDQFEELFTLCRDEAERSAFVANLLAAVDPETAGPTCAVIALRADFYAHCAAYAGLRLALERWQAYIGPMSREELRQAVEAPARQSGWTWEPGLVELILQDVGDEPGGLPLLSHALLETWRRRRGRSLTYSGYSQSGGVRGAIAQTAESIYGQLAPERQAIARSLFLRLAEPGEVGEDGLSAPDTRRRAGLAELIPAGDQAEPVRAVLNMLAEARLITLAQETAEVAHEALIREWPTLRQWLDENREALRLHRHLTEAAQTWEKLGRDPGELYRGARLAQAGEWAAAHPEALNLLEQEFLAASHALVRQREEEREAQQRRELEAAQKLVIAEQQRAEEQTRAAGRLQRRALLLAGALGLALLLAVAAVFLGRQAAQNEQQAEREARVALARELAAAAVNNLAVDAELGTLLALQAVTTTLGVDGAVLREAENALHQAVPSLRVLQRFQAHTAAVNDIALSPDGTRLVTASNDGTAKVWEIGNEQGGFEQGELFTLSGHSDWVWDVAYSGDGRYIATAGRDQTARVWNAQDGRLLLTLDDPDGEVSFVDLSADGTLLAAGDGAGVYRVWRLAAGADSLAAELRYTFTDTGGFGALAFSPTGQTLAIDANAEGGEIWLWDLEQLEGGATTISGGDGALTLCCHEELLLLGYSPDGQRLFSASNNATAKMWDVVTGQEVLTLYGHAGPVNGVAFDEAGARLVTSSGDGSAKVWSFPPGATGAQLLLTLPGQIGSVIESFFLPDGQSLVSASEGGTVTVWDSMPGRELATLAGHEGWVWDAAFSPDGQHLATAAFDLTAVVWDVASGDEHFRTPLGAHDDWINRVAFSPDGRYLATASNDATVKLWEIESGREVTTLAGHEYADDGFPYNGVGHVLFSPDGTRLLTSGGDGTVRLWDAATGMEVWRLPAHEQVITYLGLDADGTRLATVGFDARAILWDLSNWGAPPQRLVEIELPGQERGTWSAALSPDGERLAITERDGKVSVWDATPPTTGNHEQPLYTLTDHTSIVTGAAFSQDGTRLATASFDGTARVWDVATGEELLVLTGHDGGVTGVVFSPDSTRLATTSQDGTARLHVLPIEELIMLAQSRLSRGLTAEECQRFLHLAHCP